MSIKIIFSLILALVTTIASQASIITDRLYEELEASQTPADSIRILYDIFDSSERPGREPVVQQLYNVAKRSNNYTVALDAVRQLANLYVQNDSLLDLLPPLLEGIPQSDDRRETEVFISLTQTRNLSRHGSDEDRYRRIHEINDQLRTGNMADIYEQIDALGSLCILVGNNTFGIAYKDYMDEFRNLTEQLNSSSDALRNLYYSLAAIIYNNIGDHKNAVISDKRLIEITEKLQERYRREGRRYKNFDTIIYVSCRRLLGNYDSLTPEEIEKYYLMILNFAETNPVIKADLASNGLAEAYYQMATGHYEEAIPLLKKASTILTDRYFKRRIVRRLIRSAQETDNIEVLNEALADYTKILEDYINSEASSKYREMEIIYDVTDLRDSKQQLELENKNAELAFHRTIFAIGAVIFVIVIIFLIILFNLLARYRRQSKSLSEANETLKNESEELHKAQKELITARDKARVAERHKTDFINNMSHEVSTPLDAITEYSQLIVDCADTDKKEYLARYADIVKLNTELLNTLVNDVLDIGMLESSHMTIKPMPTSVQKICMMVLGAIKLRVNPGVKLIFAKENAPDSLIVTDSKRVEQVLINLLGNAAKFTESGSITFDYDIDRDQNKITFSVTDTGIGIPDGKEHMIFERFEKIHKHTQGSGLGLSICALITKLLKGEIYAEPNRASGAKFIFSIPIA